MARLEIELDEDSRARVGALARLAVPRGTHVTLAFGVEPRDFDPSWVPGGREVGSALCLRAVQEVDSHGVQALVVEIDGSSARPHDGGVLHVTVSRGPEARSKDANLALALAPRVPRALELRGVVCWAD